MEVGTPDKHGVWKVIFPIHGYWTLKMIMEKSWEWGRDKFALLIDMEKAFDCVPRNLLWKIMAEPPYYIPKKLIRVIKKHVHRQREQGEKGRCRN